MKIAVFSDVHSCYERMKAVFKDMETYRPDRFVCLGDMIGHGNEPEKTVRLLREKKVIAVKGNHERAITDSAYLSLFPKAIKKSVKENIAAISNESYRYLVNTPKYLKMGGCHFVHGTPIDKVGVYIYDVSDYYLKSIFNNTGNQVFFTGHTHKLKLVTYKVQIIFRRRLHKNCIIPIEDHQKYLLNVGSISFPRDDFSASKYAVYDTEAKQIMVRMVET